MADSGRSRIRRLLPVLLIGWTLLAWLPRIGIIPVAGGWDLARIVGSLAVGGAASYALLRPGRATPALLVVFSTWTILVWSRSLWNNWAPDNPPGLRLVHTMLAAGFLYLALLALSAARGHVIAGPDQGHRDQQ